MASAKLKINPARLPETLLPPTLPMRVDPPRAIIDKDSADERDERTNGFRLTSYDRKKQGFGKMWTYQEESELLAMKKSGDTEEEMAEKLGRSIWSVRARLSRIQSSGRIVE